MLDNYPKIQNFVILVKRILAISLLFVFITGLVNLTWATHYCGNFAVENAVSIGIEKLSCSTEEKSCCAEGENVIYGPVIKSKMCCSNDYYSSDADDFFIKVLST